jgi:predicted  nucleic acid-binding Zn-ribbon protein
MLQTVASLNKQLLDTNSEFSRKETEISLLMDQIERQKTQILDGEQRWTQQIIKSDKENLRFKKELEEVCRCRVPQWRRTLTMQLPRRSATSRSKLTR